jgi:acyl-CoA synthetase (AMP-forming)/AMP-acid ligase II
MKRDAQVFPETFAAFCRDALQRQPDQKLALLHGERRLTFGELKQLIEQYKGHFCDLGVTAGSRVAYCLPSCCELFAVVYAATALGACVVPIHPSAPAQVLIGLLLASRCSLLITIEAKAQQAASGAPRTVTLGDLARPAPPDARPAELLITSDQLAFILTSSGTTAIPKLIPATQGNAASIVATARYLIEPIDVFDRGFRALLTFPLSTSGVIPSAIQLALGCTYVLPEDLAPEAILALIEEHRVESVQGPPDYFEKLVRLRPGRFDLSSVTRIECGTDFVQNRLLFALQSLFPSLEQCSIGYGLAETCTMVMGYRAESPAHLDRPTTRFVLIESARNELRIVGEDETPLPDGQPGEIQLRGRSVVRGYLGAPELTETTFTPDGWLRTGDQGMRRPDGAVELLGRTKYIIKRAGLTVFPNQVAQQILEHEDVLSAAVVGAQSMTMGLQAAPDPGAPGEEATVAFIVLKPGREPDLESILAHCRASLLSHQVPDVVRFVSEIPKTPAGKIDLARLIASCS